LTLKELQESQLQLIQTEKMSSLGQLVAGVAHEINNPVNFICANLHYVQENSQNLLELVQLYQDYYPDSGSQIQARVEEIDLEFMQKDFPKVLDSMKLGTDRIIKIVRSLRNFSRLDEAEDKAVDIHDGIDSTLLILQHRLKGNGNLPRIEVIKNYGVLPEINCYLGQMNQVFMNILANAIDALDEGIIQGKISNQIPLIQITTEISSQHWVVIRIADNGIGISERLKQRLFEPLFTTKPVGKGTGLGLSIAHQIVVKKHNGTLQVNSQPGMGTEFMIAIPIKNL
jgi:signal transduction histidine kinase